MDKERSIAQPASDLAKVKTPPAQGNKSVNVPCIVCTPIEDWYRTHKTSDKQSIVKYTDCGKHSTSTIQARIREIGEFLLAELAKVFGKGMYET